MDLNELDIYDDLDEFHEQEQRKSKELLEWEAKYSAATETTSKLQSENKELLKKLKTIEINFQNLLNTAKAEIARKDNLIFQLRKEKDDICFRRNLTVASKQLHSEEASAAQMHKHENEISQTKEIFKSQTNSSKSDESKHNWRSKEPFCSVSLTDHHFQGKELSLQYSKPHLHDSKYSNDGFQKEENHVSDKDENLEDKKLVEKRSHYRKRHYREKKDNRTEDGSDERLTSGNNEPLLRHRENCSRELSSRYREQYYRDSDSQSREKGQHIWSEVHDSREKEHISRDKNRRPHKKERHVLEREKKRRYSSDKEYLFEDKDHNSRIDNRKPNCRNKETSWEEKEQEEAKLHHKEKKYCVEDHENQKKFFPRFKHKDSHLQKLSKNQNAHHKREDIKKKTESLEKMESAESDRYKEKEDDKFSTKPSQCEINTNSELNNPISLKKSDSNFSLVKLRRKLETKKKDTLYDTVVEHPPRSSVRSSLNCNLMPNGTGVQGSDTNFAIASGETCTDVTEPKKEELMDKKENITSLESIKCKEFFGSLNRLETSNANGIPALGDLTTTTKIDNESLKTGAVNFVCKPKSEIPLTLQEEKRIHASKNRTLEIDDTSKPEKYRKADQFHENVEILKSGELNDKSMELEVDTSEEKNDSKNAKIEKLQKQANTFINEDHEKHEIKTSNAKSLSKGGTLNKTVESEQSENKRTDCVGAFRLESQGDIEWSALNEFQNGEFRNKKAQCADTKEKKNPEDFESNKNIYNLEKRVKKKKLVVQNIDFKEAENQAVTLSSQKGPETGEFRSGENKSDEEPVAYIEDGGQKKDKKSHIQIIEDIRLPSLFDLPANGPMLKDLSEPDEKNSIEYQQTEASGLESEPKTVEIVGEDIGNRIQTEKTKKGSPIEESEDKNSTDNSKGEEAIVLKSRLTDDNSVTCLETKVLGPVSCSKGDAPADHVIECLENDNQFSVLCEAIELMTAKNSTSTSTSTLNGTKKSNGNSTPETIHTQNSGKKRHIVPQLGSVTAPITAVSAQQKSSCKHQLQRDGNTAGKLQKLLKRQKPSKRHASFSVGLKLQRQADCMATSGRGNKVLSKLIGSCSPIRKPISKKNRNHLRRILDTSSDEEVKTEVLTIKPARKCPVKIGIPQAHSRVRRAQKIAAIRNKNSIGNTNSLEAVSSAALNIFESVAPDSRSQPTTPLKERNAATATATATSVNTSQEDSNYREIDSRLEQMFKSPTCEAYKIETLDEGSRCAFSSTQEHKNNAAYATETNSRIDETMNSTTARNLMPMDESLSDISSTAHANGCINISDGGDGSGGGTATKRISLGSSDYRFEQVSENVVNLFITRKRRKRTK